MDNKQKAIGVILVIGIIALAMSGTFSNLFSLVTDTTFVKPLWARIECAKDDVSVTQSYALPKGQTEIKCGFAEFTQLCDIQVKADAAFGGGFGSLVVYYQLCDASTGKCGSFTQIPVGSNTYTQLPQLNKGQSYIIKLSNVLGVDITGNAKKIYFPFRLYDFYDGGKAVINSYNCDIPSTALQKMLAKDNPSATLQMGSWYNYVHDWVYGPANNVFTHPTYGQVYCTGHNIYSINTIKAADSSVKKLNPEYTGTAKDGTNYQGLGNLLSSVQCCPNEPNCNSNFLYDVTATLECTTDAQCITTPVAKTSTSYQFQKCVSNKCEWQTPVTVQCMNNAACPNGQICDLAVGSTQFKCINQIGTHYCGDNKCDTDESAISCPTDCAPAPQSMNYFYWIIAILVIILVAVIAYRSKK